MENNNISETQLNGTEEQAEILPNKPIFDDEPLAELAAEIEEERIEQEEYEKAVAYFRSGPMYIKD
ncbi:hypothetical protein [Shinella sp. M31]|uniref:hypothetical protein n=1 Tax=Shinella sp. M31 TaxID=3368615 RepID=UPI003B9EFA27